jgi:hypothetical protein
LRDGSDWSSEIDFLPSAESTQEYERMEEEEGARDQMMTAMVVEDGVMPSGGKSNVARRGVVVMKTRRRS